MASGNAAAREVGVEVHVGAVLAHAMVIVSLDPSRAKRSPNSPLSADHTVRPRGVASRGPLPRAVRAANDPAFSASPIEANTASEMPSWIS